jgi:hypothetical protein
VPYFKSAPGRSRRDSRPADQVASYDVPELANLPWEYLYHPTLRRFIVLSTETPITRYVNLPRPITPLKITGPLYLLVMVASPSDYQLGQSH